MQHTLGKIIGDFSNRDKVLNAVLDTCHQNHLSVITSTFHNFHPQGQTILILLGESHLSLHSYPEDNLAHVDLFSCNKTTDCEGILKDLSDRLSGSLEDVSNIDRNNDNYSWRQ